MSQNNPTTIAADKPETNAAVPCRPVRSSSFTVFLTNILAILIACKIMHSFLRPLGQHRMISEFIIGVVISNAELARFSIEDQAMMAIIRTGAMAFAFYLFALGLEMEPRSIFRWSGPATKLAYAGIISTVGTTFLCYTVIRYGKFDVNVVLPNQTIFALAIGLALTCSPVLTRLITELKIGKSEIGRLAVLTSIANDMICTSLMCVGVVIYGSNYWNPNSSYKTNVINASVQILLIGFEVFFISKFINPLIDILNDRNPEGKPIRGIDLLIVSSISFLLCFGSILVGFDANFNAFIVGLFLPREGRMSNFLINRINFTITTFILPLYVVLVGFSTDYKAWAYNHNHIWYKLLILGSVGVVGKLTGTVACSIRFGLQWPEAVALGLLLNVKGYFHFFCAFNALMMDIIDFDMMMVIVAVTLISIIPTPLVVAFIVRRTRAREQERPMGLQWCNTGGEMRILVGLQGPQDVPMAINVMESMRGQVDGLIGGLLAYMVDMVEMTDKAAASLVRGEGMDALKVTDEDVVEWREQIGSALKIYMEEIGEGVKIRRMLVVSSFDDMHEDICRAAQDCSAALVVLPFHLRLRVDGAMHSIHPGYRVVIQKVLKLAPCSVAILIDRGLGRTGSQISFSHATLNLCVVFIGGADDREALAYASKAVHHPGMRVTIVRFLQASEKMTGPGRRVLRALWKQETEMKLDDEYFVGFYERYVAGGKGVGYVDKQVGSGAEMVAMLRGMEGRYDLFVVGRGKERDSVLTEGMNEWAEWPELGPVGDVLAASDFSATASVLVIQQHDICRSFDVIDEEFLPNSL